jgi:hypothetical protein
VDLEAAVGVVAERSFYGLRNLSCLLRVAKSCSRRVISLCSISWGSSRGLKCKVTTKRIMREEGVLGEEEVILPYKQKCCGISGSSLHFFRGYIFVGSLILTLSIQIKEGF